MIKRSLLFFLVIMLFWTSNLSGQSEKHLFIGVLVPYNGIQGSDFNGDNFYEVSNELIFIPKIKYGLGWGITAGIGTEAFDGDVYFMHSSHDITFLDLSDKATLDAIGLNMRVYIIKPTVFRPYLNFAIDVSFLTARNASIAEYAPYKQGDAKFIGIGLCGGAGVAITLFDHLSLFVGAELRWNPMGQVKGVQGEYYKTEDLDSLGLCLRSGIIYRF